MAKIIPFKSPEEKPAIAVDLPDHYLTPKQAIDRLVVAMVCHVLPLWIENSWPFRGLEIMAQELKSSMLRNAPENEVQISQIDAIAEELKPLWMELARQAVDVF
jgi:hypothetical protein